jgi:hypothetical protein
MAIVSETQKVSLLYLLYLPMTFLGDLNFFISFFLVDAAELSMQLPV